MAAAWTRRSGPARSGCGWPPTEMIEAGARDREVAKHFRVSRMSANRWRRALAAAAGRRWASRGAGGAQCKLTPAQVAGLEAVLDAGPAACGYADPVLDAGPGRRAGLAAVRGGVHASRDGRAAVPARLDRAGPARRAAERDEDKIARRREGTWPAIKARRRTWAPGSASRTSPARARGRRGDARGGGAAPRWRR